MFKVSNSSFDNNLWLTKPLKDYVPNRYSNISYFDKDGFEICPLEESYYWTNNVKLGYHLRHKAFQQDWIYQSNSRISGINIDHSLILQRYGFADEALIQLQKAAYKYPPLYKLTQIQPKWGLDFSIDYVDNHFFCVTELLHFELDFLAYEDAFEAKEQLQEKILNTDWVDYHHVLMKRYSEWCTLDGDDLSDWKARFFGLKRAFDTKKVWR